MQVRQPGMLVRHRLQAVAVDLKYNELHVTHWVGALYTQTSQPMTAQGTHLRVVESR